MIIWMREQKTFGKRTAVSGGKEVHRKYLILSEGFQTEPIYFSALRAYSEALGISSLVDIIPIERSSLEKGFSNPKVLVRYLVSKLNENSNSFLFGSLINAVMEVLDGFELFQRWQGLSDKISAELRNYVEEVLGKTLTDSVEKESIRAVIQDAMLHIRGKFGYLATLVLDGSDIEASLENQLITYDESLDRICLVIDRDRKSFSSEQYNFVVSVCEKHHIDLYVSNPCFEFWLLLHYRKRNELNVPKLKKNEKNPGNNKTYTESELLNVDPTYRKNNYRVQEFIGRIDTAIMNSKEFACLVDDLENEVGSNIAFLIEKIRSE